jgi:hypothetical protein
MKDVFLRRFGGRVPIGVAAAALLAAPFVCLGQGMIAVFAGTGILLLCRGRSAMAVRLRARFWMGRTRLRWTRRGTFTSGRRLAFGK